MELASEKGASSWLSALPLKWAGYTLNRQEFRDAVCLRYGLAIRHVPCYCACGAENSLHHTLNCKKGGYVTMRHNALRDTEASFLEDCARDVNIEPKLMPISPEEEQDRSNPDLQLDISAVGIWSAFERTFMDVRVTHPLSSSYAGTSTEALFRQHEQEKKRKYQHRVLNVERGSFTPLVFMTTGGCGKEADRHHKRVAELLARKRNETYADTLNYMRTKLSFALLKCVLISLRGVRGKQARGTGDSDQLSFSLMT